MFTFSLESIEKPSMVIPVFDDMFLAIKGHVEYELLPKSIELLICDLYQIRKFEEREINIINTTLKNLVFGIKIDEELSNLLLNLKVMFNKATSEKLMVYGVGD